MSCKPLWQRLMKMHRVVVTLSPSTNMISSRGFSVFTLNRNGQFDFANVDECALFCRRWSKLQHFVLPQNVEYSTYSDDLDRGVCWKCRKQLPPASKFICIHCKAILPPSKGLSLFEMLNVPKTFDISNSTLQQNFKDLQRMFHPDKHSMSDSTEKEISAISSSFLNKAYSTLLAPLSRGIYMLELEGIFVDEKTQLDDAEFLMEVMELNEQIAEAEEEKSLRAVQSGILETCSELVSQISEAFREGDHDSARSLLIKLRYYENMTHKLKEIIPPS